MTKKTTITISILLIIAAVIIEILLKKSQTELDKEIVGFFAGILFGAGIALLLSTIVKMKKANKKEGSTL